MNVEDMMEINEHDWMAITVVQSSFVLLFFFTIVFTSFSLFPTTLVVDDDDVFAVATKNDRSEDERNMCYRPGVIIIVSFE